MLCKLLRRLGYILALATVLSFVTLASGPLVAQGQAATFPVTKTADTADGSCDSDCSLREAIIAANADPDQDTVTVPAGRYELTLGVGPEELGDTAANGDLDIRAGVAIRGAGAPSTIVVGAWDEVWEPAEGRVFHSSAPRNTSFAASISGLTVTGGVDGGIDNARRVALRLTQVAVQRNHFSRSVYGGSGGGILNDGRMEIARSTIARNSTAGRGSGGGIFNSGTLLMRNTTVSGNWAGAGGGINSSPTLRASHSTIAFNSAEAGAGVAGAGSFSNTIVSRNRDYGSTPNCSEAVHSRGHNLENGNTCGFTRPSDVRAGPRLGPLADNGGPTLTHRLLSGSPAIDAGGLIFPPTDQRGVARPQDGDGNGSAVSDIGAFEKLRAPGPVPSPTTCTRHGTPGNDVIRGTSGDDVICGGGGNDIIHGLGGNDTIRGGAGNDILRGEAGNDRLSGGDGNDHVNGGDGVDRLKGGPGRDTLTGQDGRDQLDTRDGVGPNDVASGGAGADSCATDPRDVRSSC